MFSTLYRFENGIYDTVEEKLNPFNPQYYITNIIGVDFNEQAQSDLIERFIKDISNDDEEVEQLIYEMIGYGLYRDNFYRSHFYYSPGGNGKTTLLKLLHHFYNPENTTALSFNDLNDKFKPANLQGKLVIADDMRS